MSLKTLLARTIALVLFGCLIVGAALTYWSAQTRVNVEMRAAMALGENTARRAIDDISRSPDPQNELARLVTAFDGNRHLRASVRSAGGSTLQTSALMPPENDIPDWFFELLAVAPQSVSIALPAALGQAATFHLETDSRGEVDEVWGESVLDAAIIAVFCVFILGLMTWTLGHALQPLRPLLQGFERIGLGDYAARVRESGPSELVRLSRGFNAMAERLAEMEQVNRRLNEQLTTVQDEERADLARDLHDEVSPLLFSVDVDVTTIRQMAETEENQKILARAAAIQDAVARTKRHVKSILGRLRPAEVADHGLRNVCDSLVSFWQARRPDTTFVIDVPRESWGPALDAAMYAIIREGLSNALKHSNATRIEVCVGTCAEGHRVELSIADNGGGLRTSPSGPGFGVIGMKERVAALGGTISVANRPDGQGVMVQAQLPVTELAAEERIVFAEVRAA